MRIYLNYLFMNSIKLIAMLLRSKKTYLCAYSVRIIFLLYIGMNVIYYENYQTSLSYNIPT